ncbi:MAG: CPBP family intramembrane metalloprotease [Bacteroidaceae bacterium]|nr:CPBP family intramembrane metalloprotease [Bacteroidaceae bacterium]
MWKNKWVDALWYVVVFMLIQLSCSGMASLVWSDMISNPTALCVSLAASSLITVAVFCFAKWWRESKSAVIAGKGAWKVWLWTAVIALSTIIPSLWLNDILGIEANEDMTRMMMSIIQSPLGIIVIVLLVPLAEEVVFRGAMLHRLLDVSAEDTTKKTSPILPIAFTALCFGIIHGNMEQAFHATLLGVLLGWIYYKYSSILPGVIFHITNNGTSWIMTTVFPEKEDATLLELFNNNSPLMYTALALSVAVFLCCMIKSPAAQTAKD